MAIALKEQRTVRGREAFAERPDGTRVRFQPYPTPLHDRDGHVTGAVNLLVDVGEQRQAELDAARLAAIVRSSSDAIISKTLDGVITTWNHGATRIFGYEAEEIIGQPVTRLIPPELQHEEVEILARLRRGESIEHYDTVRLTKDGRRVHISLSVSPLKDRSGRLVGASKVARDITQRKQAEETQRLLMAELNHRVKNTLATVQAIANQTARSGKSPSEFIPSFLGRLQSLSSAHTLLTQTNWQGANLGELIRSQVLIDGEPDERLRLSGPQITLNSKLALHLALVLHELGTNARKHGALSTSRGEVNVSWSVKSPVEPSLQMQWKESGGPPVYIENDVKRGFGTTLIHRSVQHGAGGEANMSIEASGVTWSFSIPLPDCSPLANEIRAQRRDHLAQTTLSAAVARLKVLVVEDEPLVGMEIAATLGDSGFDVIGPLAVPDEALRAVHNSHPDIALLDANLGGRPVDEIAAALTRLNVPFAFVTGYGRESLPVAFAAAPILAKPFLPSTLLDLTKRLAAQDEDVVPLRRPSLS
jgi:PAS domain S-box-containing protein